MRRMVLPLFAIAALGLAAGTATAVWDEPKTGGPIQVDLTEWSLGFDILELDGSKVTFAIANRGGAPHALTIEGTAGGEAVRISSPVLRSGQSATLEVQLAPGEYVAYCPVGGHRGLGMEGRIIIRDS